MIDFTMPSLGADMDAGKLLEWYVQPGQEVHRGDIVALVDTDKAAIEVEVWDDGVVDSLLIQPGEKVPVGTVLAHLRAPGEAAGVAVQDGAPAPAGPEEPRLAPEPAVAAPSATVEGAVPTHAAAPHATPPHATPSARAAAREAGLDVRALRGTGKHGVVTHADVLAASAVTPEMAEMAAAPRTPSAPRTPAVTPSTGRPHVTPRARRLARERGVDLGAVAGTGPSGAITGDDVEAVALRGVAAAEAPAEQAPAARPAVAASAAQPAQPPPVTPREKPGDERYAAMRRAIAAAMAKSKREIPHYYLGQPIDLERALTWLEERNLERPLPERILPATLLLRATVLALEDVPEMNGFWRQDGFEPASRIHMGLGISLRQGGLIAPAILDAQEKDLPAMMAAVRDLVARARTLQLRSSEMSDATVTVTALGDQGVEFVHGVIYPPQVALIGFGTVRARPWAENGMLGVRRIVQATLAADHRASDGHTGGRFLAALDRHLQHPEEL